jgi:hypothetical protein
MKKFYVFLLAPILVTTSFNLRGQTCNLAPPVVSGNTLAACSSAHSFSLTASGQATNTMVWYNSGGQVGTGTVFNTPPLSGPATYSVAQMGGIGNQTLTMPSHNSSYGTMVRGYWFQSPVNWTITGVWVPTDVGTSNASAAVIKLPSAPPSFPTTTSAFTLAFLAQNVPGVAVMTVNIPVMAGEYIGVLGSRGSQTSYGTSPSIVNLGTNTISIARFGMQYDLSTTVPQDVWTESGGSVGRVFLNGIVACMSSLTPVSLSVTPNAVISVNSSTTKICAGTSVSLSAQGVNTYTWSNSMQGPNIVVNPSSSTTYTAFGTGNSCTASAVVTISVDPGPPVLTPVISNSVVCQGHTVSLTGTGSSSGTYSWSSGITNSVAFTPTATSSYTVLSANSCGTGSAVASLVVNPNPTIVTAVVTTICEGEQVTLSATGALGYTWNPGNQIGNNIVVTPSVSTPFVATGTNQYGCSSTANHVVLVNPNPTVAAGASGTAVCPGGSVTVSASGSGGTYSWSTGGQGASQTVTPQQPAVYSVTLTNSYSCSASANVSIGVYQPTISISQPTGVCEGSAATLSGGSAAGYTWLPGGSNFSSFNFTPQATSTYTLKALVNMGGGAVCTASNTALVTVNPNPTVIASTSRTVVCRNETGTLQASGAATYNWGITGQGANVPVMFISNGLQNYSVTGTDIHGCKNTASLKVQVNACNTTEEYPAALAFRVYPNPSKGSIQISSGNAMTLILYSALGQIIARLELDEGNHFTASVDELAGGVYFISAPQGSLVNKVIVSR